MTINVTFRRTMLGVVLCAVALIAAASSVRASPADTLADNLQRWMQRYNVPAASLAVMQDDKLAGSYGYGGWTADQKHRVASLSKAITGVCIARLAQAGRLSFGDTLGTVLAKTFERLGEPADPRFKTITIEQLLTHRGGLARDVPPDDVVPAETMDERFQHVLAARLAYDPGRSMLYSNIGYLTLGMVAEAVTGQSYAAVCRREALDPMGVSAEIDPVLRQRAPNGGWLISAIDYARFVQIFDHNNPNLSKATHSWLETQAGQYGMGTFVRYMPDGLEFSHDGEVAGRLGGGSLSVKRASGWTAVIIFGGPTVETTAYIALRQIVDVSLPR